MDTQTYKQAISVTERQKGRQISRQTSEHRGRNRKGRVKLRDRQTVKMADGKTGSGEDRQLYRQHTDTCTNADRQTGRLADRQTERIQTQSNRHTMRQRETDK